MKILLGVLFVALVVIGITIYSALSWGYVVSILATWFIIPIFPELHELTWVQYAGVILFVRALTYIRPTSIKEKYKKKHSDLTSTLLAPWLTLLIGSIIKSILF